MEKMLDDGPKGRGNFKRLMLFGKTTLIMVALFALQAQAAVWSQETRVTMKLERATVKEVIGEIKRQTGYSFVYSDADVTGVSCDGVDFVDETVERVLAVCLEGSGLNFSVEDRTIIIWRGEKRPVAQLNEQVVKGRVTDTHGNPLPGVTVLIKGTSLGVATDADGRFELVQPSDTVGELVFSFVGMKTVTMKWEKGKELKVVMEPESEEMAEVVVTGYGDVAKGNYTGAAYTVKAEEILMAGTSTIDQMLQGVIPGVLVMNQTGQVGATPKIRVRGTSTLLGSQEPVWVVDGVIQRDPQPFYSSENTKFSVDADDIKELAGNAISWLNPNDIESITVLKDASATAIYGSQAANGVIVITTKKAQVGRVQVSYSGDFSIGQRPRYGLYDLMNSAERMELSREIYEEKRYVSTSASNLLIGFDALLEQYRNKEATIAELQAEYEKMARQNTDWFDILFRNSFNHSHNLSISGGSDKIQNRTSFSFTQENGEAKGNNMTQFSATSNTTVNLKDYVSLNLLLKGSVRDVEGFAYGVDPFTYAYETSRVIPCYNEDGSLYYHQKRGLTSSIINSDIYNYNILNEKANTGSENRTRTWGVTVDLRLNILPGLEYQGLFSYTSSSSDSKQWASERSFYITQNRGYEYGAFGPSDSEVDMSPLPMGGLLETDLINTTTITVRNSLVYDKLFGDKHRMTLQLGIETNSAKVKGESNTRYGYMPDRGETFTNPPAEYTTSGGGTNDNTYISQGYHSVLNTVENKLSEYGMAVYTYDDRYVLNVSGRVDASNRFGQDRNKKFQPTWSVGLKWRVANERFARGRWWLNNLDVYGSYGYQGNAVTTVSPELITSFNSVLYDMAMNAQDIVSVPNPDLGWEKTKTWNIGVEGSLLEGRLNFTFNYFKKKSYVLSSRAIPYENGDSNGIVGGTEMNNDGYDLLMNVIPVQTRDFTWQLSLNTSVTHNSVETKRINTLNDYTSGSCLMEGRPFSTFYSYVFVGLDEEYGQPMFKNMNQYGDIFYGVEAEVVEDITDIMEESGKFVPDFSGGFNTMLKWRNLSLYALFTLQWGGHGRLPDLYDTAEFSSGLPRAERNASVKLKDRWKKPGDKTDIPALGGTGIDNVNVPIVSSFMTSAQVMNRYEVYNLSNAQVANTDFIRCRQVSLSYDFEGKWMEQVGIDYLQLKASMTNPFMWVSDKKWDGLDPETQDWPTRRVTSFSLQLIF